MKSAKVHCNECGGERHHTILHSERTSWASENDEISGSDTYDMLKCNGCDAVRLRHISMFSEDDAPSVTFLPPAIARRQPDWLSNDLWKVLPDEEGFVESLLREIYVALHNNLPRLATMGVRSLIEKMMIAKVGDLGTFSGNMEAFEKAGYVSSLQKERLKTILEAGHATTHRDFLPSSKDVNTVVDIAEHVVETLYLHQSRVDDLKRRVPPRNKRK